MKKLILAGLVALSTWGVIATTPAQADPPQDCSLVLCLTCPPGTVASPTKHNCCRCVPQ
jgi:hypothetical protein